MNYEDERFKKVEAEKEAELAKVNQTYQDLLNERNALTTEQSALVDQWQNTQSENLDKQLVILPSPGISIITSSKLLTLLG